MLFTSFLLLDFRVIGIFRKFLSPRVAQLFIYKIVLLKGIVRSSGLRMLNEITVLKTSENSHKNAGFRWHPFYTQNPNNCF